MDLLKKILSLKSVQQFIYNCDAIAQKNPAYINNGIGVNYSENEVESIKLYFGFHHKLSQADIEKLHVFGTKDLFNTLESKLIKSDYEWHEFYPTGVSFAIKVDKHLNQSFGHFMMPKLQKDDLFFSLPKVKEYYMNHHQLPIINRKGIFTLIDQKGAVHHKDYFYVTNKYLKNEIGKSYNVDTSIVPSIEWVIGKGFYDGSSPNDEKIVLQANYDEVYHGIIKNETWSHVLQFNALMQKKFNTYCVCPGFYKNKKIKSYYYFNASLPTLTYVNTIPSILENIHLLG